MSSSIQCGRTVRSSAADVAQAYFRWLRGFTLGFIRVGGDPLAIRLLGLPLIRLAPRPDEGSERQVMRVDGGLVARPGGEFRFEMQGPQRVRITLEGYRTRLPRWLYRWTQEALHELVMARFMAWLAKEEGS